MESLAPNSEDDSVTAKVVLLGDGGTGKSTFVQRYVVGDFEASYEPTIGIHVYPITFETSVGQPVCFNCWDTSGQERLGTNRDAYYRGALCAILFFDVQSRLTYKNCPAWFRDLTRVESNVDVVLVGNKVDVTQRQVKPKQVNFHRKVQIPYIEMSAKSNYNVEKPFLHFARKLLKDEEVELLEGTAMAAPEIELDLQLLETEADHEDEVLDQESSMSDF